MKLFKQKKKDKEIWKKSDCQFCGEKNCNHYGECIDDSIIEDNISVIGICDKCYRILDYSDGKSLIQIHGFNLVTKEKFIELRDKILEKEGIKRKKFWKQEQEAIKNLSYLEKKYSSKKLSGNLVDVNLIERIRLW